MYEITTYDERDEWRKTRKRIGFIGGDETVVLQNYIWTIGLYQKDDGGYSVFIELDDESWFVHDF